MPESNPSTETEKRKAALLTNSQRAFLRGEKNLKPATVRRTRADIRDRFRDVMRDMTILAEHLDDRDVDQLLDPDVMSEAELAEVQSGVKAALTILYIGTRDNTPGFESHLDYAVRVGEKYLSPAHTLDTTFEFNVDSEPLDGPTVQDTFRKMAKSEFDDLTPAQMRQFLELAMMGMLPSVDIGEGDEDVKRAIDEITDRNRALRSENELPADNIRRMQKDERGAESDESDNGH